MPGFELLAPGPKTQKAMYTSFACAHFAPHIGRGLMWAQQSACGGVKSEVEYLRVSECKA